MRNNDATVNGLARTRLNPRPGSLQGQAFDFARIGIYPRSPKQDTTVSRQRNPPDRRLSPEAEARFEREAQDAARQVTTEPRSPASMEGAHPLLSGVSGRQESDLRSFTPPSGGRPLDPAVLGEFERRFGCSLSETRVHTDQQAARSADDLDARAFTFGKHISFGEGQYAPQTPAGRTLLAHELAHVVQQSSSLPVIQRQPKKDSPAKTYPAFQPADQVLELTRDLKDNWTIVLSGHRSESSAIRAIWPKGEAPDGVTVHLDFALLEPIEQGTFILSGITWGSLSTMDPSIAKLFKDRGLEDESKESPELVEARTAFRKEHEDLGTSDLDTIDLALKKVTKRNPDLLLAYYRYYAGHDLKKADDLGKEAGDTSGGDTKINDKVLHLESSFPTDDPISLLGETLLHEFSHTPQGPKELGVGYVPKEAKAYAIERFFAERVGDQTRVGVIERRYSGTDPMDMKLGGNQIFDRTDRILTALYKVIDARGPEAEKARKMSADFIAHNEEDYGSDLKEFIQKQAL